MSTILHASCSSEAARLAARLQRATGLLTVMLTALIGAWLLLDHFSLARLMWSVAATLPLWIALPRLYRGHRRTYAWMTLAVIPYLVFAIVEAIATPDERAWAGACLFLTFALFVLLIAWLRVAGRRDQ